MDEGMAARRTAISEIDETLVELVAERWTLAREIGEAKLAAGLPILDPRREAEVVRHAAELARKHGLHEEDVRRLFWSLIALCRRSQVEP